MTSFREGLNYPPIKIGLILLLLAFLMSLAASYNVLREESQAGIWGPGTYVIGDEIEASGEIVGINLEVSSDNASLRIIENGLETTYTLSGRAETLEFNSTP